jgi:DNA modification methylase
VLGNATFMMSGVAVLNSIADPIFDSNFVSPPEYGVYAQSKGLGSLVLSNSQVKLLLNPSTSDYQTLLNPDNMRAFYKQYVEGGYSNIFTRYGFTSNA